MDKYQEQPRSGLWRWLCHQGQAWLMGWHYLRRLRWRSFLMVLSMGVTLALPVAGIRALQVGKTMLGQWHQHDHIAAYLYPHLSAQVEREAVQRMDAYEPVAHVHWMTPEHGRQLLTQHLDEKLIKEVLHDKPLPTTLLITLKPGCTFEKAQQLVQRLKHNPSIEHVDAHVTWLAQLAHLVHLWQHVVSLMSLAILSLVVFLLSQTSSLLVWIHKRDCQLLSLLGASPAAIGRPFRLAAVTLCVSACGVATGVVAWMHHDIAPFFKAFTSAFFKEPLVFPPWPWHWMLVGSALLVLMVFLGTRPALDDA